MVRGRCGLVETDDEATTRATVAAKVAELVTDEAERRWIGSALLSLLGFESDVGPQTSCSAPGARSSSDSLHRGPSLMVFEDLHYADRWPARLHRSRARVEQGRCRSTSSRSRDRSSSSAGRIGAPASATSSSISLEPLPERGHARAAGGARARPAGARQSAPIVARADGIPLYAVETVRMLVAEGRLVRRTASTCRSAT